MSGEHALQAALRAECEADAGCPNREDLRPSPGDVAALARQIAADAMGAAYAIRCAVNASPQSSALLFATLASLEYVHFCKGDV